MPNVTMTVNGKTVSGSVEGRTLLVEFIRNDLHLTGTHVGCDTSQCGACAIHVDGKLVKACTMFALEANGATIIIRILSGILFCTLLNSAFSTFELLDQIAVLNLPEMSSAPTLQQWIADQIKGLIFIQIVIVILITFLEILRLIGIEKIIRICLSPFLKILNIGQSASTIVVVGLTLGLGFGGGLMIKDVKQGLVAPRSAVGALIFINLFHSLIEDTTILLLIGPSLFTILVIRGLFVFALTFLLIKIFNNLPFNAYNRFLFSRPINNLIKNQN